MSAEANLALPAPHARMVDRAVAAVRSDGRFVALLGSGSLAYGGFDEQSDLDFVIVVRSEDHGSALAGGPEFARRLGPLLAAFTGEHVGEPRLLICLYGPPLLHVDLKFITSDDLTDFADPPVILWARDEGEIERHAAVTPTAGRDAQWYEDRAWVWLHYVATKLLRGELFEAIGGLDYFRDVVLGAMLQRNAGRRPRGVRRIERIDGAVALLAPTVPAPERRSIADALEQSAALYVELRRAAPPASPVERMPGALLDFLAGKQSPA